MRDKPDIQATPLEVIEKLLARETDLKREKGLAPETPLFTKMARVRKGGGQGAQAGADTSNNSRDTAGTSTEGRTCHHCQKKDHISRGCYSRKSEAAIVSVLNPESTIEDF